VSSISVIGLEDNGPDSSIVELANAAPYPSIIDVKNVDGAVVPALSSDPRHAAQIELVRRQGHFVSALIGAMDRYDLSALANFDPTTAEKNARSFAWFISRQHILRELFLAEAEEDDANVLRQLGYPEFYPNKP
jgi:hypothetical protein